jgi:hypothetical protein
MDNVRATSCPRLPRAENYFVVKFRIRVSRFDDKDGGTRP